MEKIVARRLTVMAEFQPILHSHQIEDRRQKSAINTVMALIHEVQANWRTRKRTYVTSFVTLDVKNAYPHIGLAQFARIYITIGLPEILIR